MKGQYPTLFSTGSIGGLTLKNRAVMTATMTGYPALGGEATERIIRFYEERARGGAGLIITEAGVVDERHGAVRHNQLHYTRRCIAGLERLCECIHRHGAHVFAQLWHGGGIVSPEVTGREALSAGDVPSLPGVPVRPASKSEIARLMACYADSARVCQLAGYDGVEIHAAHGYLIAQFLDPYFNRREDEYGGCFENRVRFLDEILAAVREAVGPRFPVSVRISADELAQEHSPLHPGLEDGLRLARHLDESGLVDVLNVSYGNKFNPNANCDPYCYPAGWKSEIARTVREAVSLPTISTNTIKTPMEAETTLREGASDFVAITRGQLADPQFIAKAKRGLEEQIRGCIGCLVCRDPRGSGQMAMRCTVNPRLGFEADYPPPPKDGDDRPVAVVGGGPAGMEAAMTLAERGFQVTLFESAHRLGGTLNIADRPAHKEKLTRLNDSMQAQLRAAGGRVELGVEATPTVLSALQPVGVFVAAGAEPVKPNLPGIGLPHVHTAEAVIGGNLSLPGRVAVVGTGLTGLETAKLLGETGSELLLIEMQNQIGPGLLPEILGEMKRSLDCVAPKIYTSHRLESIDEKGVTLTCLESGSQVRLAADAVVLALGVRPRQALAEEFVRDFDCVIPVGDARKGGRITEAIHDGFTKAWAFAPLAESER